MGTYRQPAANIDKTHAALTAQVNKVGDSVLEWGKTIAKQRQQAAALKTKQLKEQKRLLDQAEKNKATTNKDIIDLTQSFNELDIDPDAVVGEFGEEQLANLNTFLNDPTNADFIKADGTVDLDKLKLSDEWREFQGDENVISGTERVVTGIYMDKLKPGMTIDEITSTDYSTTYTLQMQGTDLMKGYLDIMSQVGDSKDPEYMLAKKAGENLIKNFNLTNDLLNKTIGANYNDAYTDPGNGGALVRKAYNKPGAFLFTNDPNNAIYMSLTDDIKTGDANSPYWGVHNTATNYALTYDDPFLDQTLVMKRDDIEKYISTIGKGVGFVGQVNGNAPTLMLDFIYKPSAKNNAGGLNAGAEYESLMEVIRTKDQQGDMTEETVIENYAKANAYMQTQINSFVETSMDSLPFDIVQSTYQLFSLQDKGLGKVYTGTDEQKQAMKEALYAEFTEKYGKGNADEVLKKHKITEADVNKGTKNYTKSEAKKIATEDGISIYADDANTSAIRTMLELEDDAIAFDLKDIREHTSQFIDDKGKLVQLLNSLKKTNQTSGGSQKKYMTGEQIKALDPEANVEDGKVYLKSNNQYYPQDSFDTQNKNQLYKAIELNILNALGKSGSTVTGVLDEELKDIEVAAIDLNDDNALRQYYQNQSA